MIAPAERFTSSQLGLSRWLRADGKTNYVTRDPRGALVGQRTPDKGRHYYLSDSLATIVAMTDERGEVSARYAYEPFGSPLASSSESVPSPFRFTGQVYDAAYGFYKLGLRYMASSQGRFTQNDPLVGFQDPRRANRYIYAGQDPVNMVDPDGRSFGKKLLYGIETLETGAYTLVAGGITFLGTTSCLAVTAGLASVGCGVFAAGGALTTAAGAYSTYRFGDKFLKEPID